MTKKFYITTAIDYVNSLPHIGTAYEKIGADVLARFHRLQGTPVYFQMGSDEHSTNVLKASQKQNLTPQKYCDEMRKKFESVWKTLNISYDNFIQTSEERHKKGVQKFFKELHKKGDIYKAPYEGWYCESCEAFYTEKDLVEGLCPNHKTKPAWLQEENYYFALSKYQDRLHKYIKEHKEFIEPPMRRNEILRLIERGLKDVSISRPATEWGIPTPIDKEHSVYVWFDALINYITAIGYGTTPALFKKWWPADLHVIGKDITRFHCVIWPAMLMAAKIPLPKTVFGHGFVYLKGEKMSKTMGNVVDPLKIAETYGADPLRYYLLRTASFGADSDFTWDDFIRRYNGDLANGLGNVVERTVGMIEQYLKGEVKPVKGHPNALDRQLASKLTKISPQLQKFLDPAKGDIAFHDALAALWSGITLLDRYINETIPWQLIKQGKQRRVAEILYHLTEGLRIVAILLAPFLPETGQKIWDRLGLAVFGSYAEQNLDKTQKWGLINKPLQMKKGEGIFPRIEETKEKKMTTTEQPTNQIDIQDFAKIDLRVAQIIEAQKIEGADRLLCLQVDLGTERRQIVAGIAQHYKPEELIGKKVVIVANLKPVKLRGVESHGMLLAASDDSGLSVVAPAKEISAGSKVK